MTVQVLKSATPVLSIVTSAFARLGQMLACIGAAGAVANAVENHRQPNQADLAMLGLAGVEFKTRY